MDANLKLLNDVQSSTIVTTSSLFPPIQRIVAERKTTIIELPALEQLVHDDADYSYDKDLSTMHNETAFMVHSSGSTGKNAIERLTSAERFRVSQTDAHLPRLPFASSAEHRARTTRRL